jgi:hypothetical protein
MKWSRLHLRDRKRWILIPLSLGNRGGPFLRGAEDDSAVNLTLAKQKQNIILFSAVCQ